jgi:hypothetical protein
MCLAISDDVTSFHNNHLRSAIRIEVARGKIDEIANEMNVQDDNQAFPTFLNCRKHVELSALSADS